MTAAHTIDLRSDTVTRPTPAMRAAMAAAPVGDDQFGEDPTVNLLQERVASLLGKEAALWLPSGTMANQVAVRSLTRPGDEIIVSRESHLAWHETGAAAANSGVQLTEIGSRSGFTADEFLAARKPRGHMLYPPTTVVSIENTHNRGGGVIVSATVAREVCDAARAHDVATFLDGARLWNAHAATGAGIASLAEPFDVVSVALSKGLGAPAGSLLAGTREFVARATRYRRMLGGAMRQVGIYAAAGLHALDHHLERLVEDHANARVIADRLARNPAVVLDPNSVRSNIVVFGLTAEAVDANTLVSRAREAGVLVVAFGARTVRAVTHLDVTREECVRAADILADSVS
jgi:threonine aldolase